jgi:hypothetical protein
MDSFHFKRTNSRSPMFTREELVNSLSDDFNLVRTFTNEKNQVTGFIVIHNKFPEVLDPISKGLEFTYQDEEYYLPGVYAFDPRMLDNKQMQIFMDEIVVDLTTDLELEELMDY